MKTLDFLCIGAGKSGTTSLHNYLRGHPRIFLPLEKEAPFFLRAGLTPQDWANFAESHFAGADPNLLWGKITPQYMGDPQIPSYIAGMMPDVKLIALLRNPIDRAYSYYRMMVRAERETRTFDAAVADQLRPGNLQTARTEPYNVEAAANSYVARGEYGRILSEYYSHFPHDQILITFTEALDARPDLVLAQILTFLGLASGYSPANLGRRYYVGGDRQRFPWLIPMAKGFSPLRWVWLKIPYETRKRIFWWYKTEFNVVQSKDSICLETRKQLIEFYKPDVDRLEKLIGIPCPWPDFRLASTI